MPNVPNPKVTDAKGAPYHEPRGPLELPAADVKAGDEAGGMTASRITPGVFGTKGDPYTYQMNEDGSITILAGPTGVGTKLDKGVAYDAIKGQIESGILTHIPTPLASARASRGEMGVDPVTGATIPTPLREARQRRSMDDKVDDAFTKAMGET